jgi:exonuclease VII large subunit
MNTKLLALTSGVVLTLLSIGSCSTPAEKAEKADTKVEEAKTDLMDAKKDASAADKAAMEAAAWKSFKEETERKITRNELRIDELKSSIKKSGTKAAALYNKSVDSLEARNKNLKMKLDNYSVGKTNWETFKEEMNSDMNGLGEALKNFTISEKDKK